MTLYRFESSYHIGKAVMIESDVRNEKCAFLAQGSKKQLRSSGPAIGIWLALNLSEQNHVAFNSSFCLG